MKVPALIISDAPNSGTGFGRITGDITSRAATNLNDVYRVATVGYGGINSHNLPCHHYPVNMDDWIIPNLKEIWEDWAGRENGVVMFVSDPARLGWFARPDMSEELLKYPTLKKFLTNPPFKKWIYAPLDASGPNGRLTFPLGQIFLGFDRILAYGKWGEDIIRMTLLDKESENKGLSSLPHGVDSDIFYPRNRVTSRAFFFPITRAAALRGEKELIQSDETIIGIVATNQSRKDFGLAVEAVSILSRRRKIRLWIHTDILERHWSIPALLIDFGLVDRTVISLGHIPDEAMAKAYSACDLMLGIGPEGFGLPNAEALACGTPVITGSFSGSSDFVPKKMQVPPVAYRYESVWACKRPVYDPADWAAKSAKWIGERTDLDSKYKWENLWKEWDKWFREGLNDTPTS